MDLYSISTYIVTRKITSQSIPSYSRVQDVEVDNNGSIYISGEVDSTYFENEYGHGRHSYNNYVLKISDEGELHWLKKLGTSSIGHDVRVLGDGKIQMAGFWRDYSNIKNDDLFSVKLDQTGRVIDLEEKIHSGNGHSFNHPLSLLMDMVP